MKVIAIGDIHGSTIWKDIVNQEFDLLSEARWECKMLIKKLYI